MPIIVTNITLTVTAVIYFVHITDSLTALLCTLQLNATLFIIVNSRLYPLSLFYFIDWKANVTVVTLGEFVNPSPS